MRLLVFAIITLGDIIAAVLVFLCYLHNGFLNLWQLIFVLDTAHCGSWHKSLRSSSNHASSVLLLHSIIDCPAMMIGL